MFSFPIYGWETEAGRDQFAFLRSKNSAVWQMRGRSVSVRAHFLVTESYY